MNLDYFIFVNNIFRYRAPEMKKINYNKIILFLKIQANIV